MTLRRLAGALAGFLFAVSDVAVGQTVISYSSHLPVDSRLHVQALDPFFRAVERSTRHAVRFSLAPGGIVAGAGSAPAALREGVVDGALLASQPLAGEVWIVGVLAALAPSVRDPRIATAALNETLLRRCPACLASFVEQGIQPLGLVVGDPPLLHCRAPVTDLKSLRGLRIAAGPNLHPLLQSLRALPEEQPILVVADRLLDGRLDCVGIPASAAAREVGGPAQHVTNLPLAGAPTSYLLMFARKNWATLPERTRRAMIAAAPIALRGAVQSALTQASTFRAVASERGTVWNEAAPDLATKVEDYWREQTDPPAAQRRDAATAKEAAVRFREAVVKWGRLVNDDFDDYEAALRREIYSGLIP